MQVVAPDDRPQIGRPDASRHRSRAAPRRAESREPLPTAADFPGCRLVPMSIDEFAQTRQRVEYWDVRDGGVAWICNDASKEHERPSHRLSMLMHRIALARGAKIECYGSMDLCERGSDGKNERIMEADQTIYLDVKRANILYSPVMVLGRHAPPDIVLEVDHTTDSRRKKLAIYECWGFPELWIEVPDVRARSRPKSRKAQLTIYTMQEGGLKESPASVALPGWTAEEIHVALNEDDISPRTYRVLERVGLALGRQEGTGPEHDPFMRSIMLQTRAEGREEGRVQALIATAYRILNYRGIECSVATLAESEAFAACEDAQVVDAAMVCASEAALIATLAGRAGSGRT